MMNKLTTLQKIDEVLHHIAVKSDIETVTKYENISQGLGKIYPEQIGMVELTIIIKKLKSDGYVEELLIDGLPHYYITFNGSLYSEQGGYYKENELRNSTLKNAKNNTLFD